MNWKKALVILGVIATYPVVLVAGFMIADPFYMRFIFQGERSDFAPGDTFGVLFYAVLFSVVLFEAAAFGGRHVYRKILG
jgi:hypothetical protein